MNHVLGKDTGNLRGRCGTCGKRIMYDYLRELWVTNRRRNARCKPRRNNGKANP